MLTIVERYRAAGSGSKYVDYCVMLPPPPRDRMVWAKRLGYFKRLKPRTTFLQCHLSTLAYELDIPDIKPTLEVG